MTERLIDKRRHPPSTKVFKLILELDGLSNSHAICAVGLVVGQARDEENAYPS